MQEKLFVGGLSWNTDEAALRAAFEPFGAVTEATIITDRESGRSRGFGFVTMDSPASANEAIGKMDGASLDGRTLKVGVAQAKKSGGGRQNNRW